MLNLRKRKFKQKEIESHDIAVLQAVVSTGILSSGLVLHVVSEWGAVGHEELAEYQDKT